MSTRRHETHARFDFPSEMENILQTERPLTRSILLMDRTATKMGLSKDEVNELISPQQLIVFRTPCKILGRVVNFWGCLALHNSARGPFKGGIRLGADVSIWETAELARLMTLKCAACDIEFGGGKTGIRVDMPAMYQLFERTPRDLDFEKIISLDAVEYYAQSFRDIFSKHIYVPAPDMGTGPDEMAFIYNETLDPASVTGKPEGTHGWLPGRKESTGVGCAYVCLRALNELVRRDPQGATVAIQGFGNVGQPLAQSLSAAGVKVVGVTDLYGGVCNPDGLDIDGLIEHFGKQATVGGFTGGRAIANEELFTLDVDVLVPAAAGDVISSANAADIRARCIVEAANMPTTVNGMDILQERNIPIVPDILANAGGVIASMLEYSTSLSAIKPEKHDVLDAVCKKIGDNLTLAIEKANEEKVSISEAAVAIATHRVYQAMKHRRML
jgi:glutamate dehydrogenase (NAD(P)+)